MKPLIEDRSFLKHFWHPVCTRAELEEAHPSGRGPHAVTLLGRKLVVANLGGRIVAMDDRCAHRFAALSKGTVVGDTLRCNYHGWLYDALTVALGSDAGLSVIVGQAMFRL